MDDQSKFNHYVCEKCGRRTITKHRDPGVTPFMIGCRATKDPRSGKGCEGMAYSRFYRVSQDDSQQPHGIWQRASSDAELDEWIEKAIPESRAWLRDHHSKGGAILMETERSNRWDVSRRVNEP